MKNSTINSNIICDEYIDKQIFFWLFVFCFSSIVCLIFSFAFRFFVFSSRFFLFLSFYFIVMWRHSRFQPIVLRIDKDLRTDMQHKQTKITCSSVGWKTAEGFVYEIGHGNEGKCAISYWFNRFSCIFIWKWVLSSLVLVFVIQNCCV